MRLAAEGLPLENHADKPFAVDALFGSDPTLLESHQCLSWTTTMQTLPLYHSVRTWFREKRQARRLIQWSKAGKPVPPPHIVKQLALKESLNSSGVRILVETGTFRGDMVEAMRRHVDRIFSIELSETFAQRAVDRFRNASNVEIISGDSGEELRKLVPRLSGPTLFWLDGHYSGGTTAHGAEATPIFAELETVLKAEQRRHIVVIDDARCFGTDPAYPTLAELEQFVYSLRHDVRMTVQDDLIRILPV